ncbi:MAG: hypothetical protein JNM14_05845 [Ferruginibacter sp.]|nr:hypothetical protein [Ferruginibacter sp.]
MKKYFVPILMLASLASSAQTKSPVKVSGTAGITYEGYGLTRRPSGWTGYGPRRPWNQVRFNFAPTFQFGKNFTLPVNFNFAAFPTNFAGPYSGLGASGKQSFKQFITNPMNNFSLNPKYKWAEVQLGTQYLKYSDLSTGDVGIFGAGFSLSPKSIRIKFFTGVSQQGINYAAGPPVINGAYKRNHWMFQLGTEKEGQYLFAFNIAKGKDKISSATPAISVRPQEGLTMSFVANVFAEKGWYVKMEGAQSVFTKDQASSTSSATKSLKPFITGRLSTITDYAGQLAVGKKSTNFDIGASVKYIGAGFQTTGYPYLQPDRLDYTLDTRFNAWKSKEGNFKMNVIASVGQRVNNLSGTAARAKQFLGSLNWFTQFNDHWSLNVNYNNFGFNAPPSAGNPFGIKNVSNDFGVNPVYTWSNTKMSHMLGMSYNYSKYDERNGSTGVITTNNTHTALFTYVPVYFTKDISPDFSAMYFYNDVPLAKLSLLTICAGLSKPVAKNKIKLRGQLQYTLGKLNSFTPNNNLIASCSIDWMLTKKLSWNTYLTTNYFKYGNEIIPNGANYLESTCRTGLQLKF